MTVSLSCKPKFLSKLNKRTASMQWLFYVLVPSSGVNRILLSPANRRVTAGWVISDLLHYFEIFISTRGLDDRLN